MNIEASTPSTLGVITKSELSIEDLDDNQIPLEGLHSAKYATNNPSSGVSEVVAQSVAPSYENVDKFLADVKFDSGLSKEDLDKVIQGTSADDNKSIVATFVRDNFNDISQLSANGGDKLSRDDLSLYSEILKHSKKNIEAGKPAESGLHDVYFAHENKQGLALPALGMIGGVFGADALYKSILMSEPVFSATFRSLLSNPRGTAYAVAGARVLSWLGGAIGGSTVGGMVDRSMQHGPLQTHYLDEAAPAMKRLLQK